MASSGNQNQQNKFSKPESDVIVKKEPGLNLPINTSISSGLQASLGALGANRLKSISRLPSFKGPRDLTLSSLCPSLSLQPQITRTKKAFVPNIPQRRDKGETAVESKSDKSPRKKPFNRNQKDGGGGRGRGRGKDREFVQTRGSLFGEGIAAGSVRRAGAGRSLGGYGPGAGSGKGPSDIQKPVLNPDAAYNVDKDFEEKRLKELLRDDFIDDPDDVTILNHAPILLPTVASAKLAPGGVSEMDHLGEALKKSGSIASPNHLKVKKEPGILEDEKDEDVINTLTETHSGEKSAAHIFSSSEDSGMLFIQFPSCLPGHPPEIKTESQPEVHNSSQNSTQNQTNTEPSNSSTTPQMCTLHTLPEGRIGTLKVYESGRVDLCLGDHTLQIEKATEVGFLQKSVRIQTDAETRTGSLFALGKIEERFVCTPDFEAIAYKLKNS